VLDDDWTVVTTDGKACLQWEHTVGRPRRRHLGAQREDGGASSLHRSASSRFPIRA
jgi:hypothetical protein